MRKFLFTMFVIILCVSLLSGCQTNRTCKHNWERTENFNEYTAMDKCSRCGITRKYIDTENIPDPGAEIGFKMRRYSWDGSGVSSGKEISDCGLAYAIIDCLSKLQETGDIIPKISDDVIDEFVYDLPVDKGTVWIECGSVGLFRLNPEMTEICKVQTHLGEGKVLQMTDTLRELLIQAYNYYPNDCWYGTYENGEITLQQVYKADSAVDWVEIEKIYVENAHHSQNNKIKFSIIANESKTLNVKLRSYASSDNLGSYDSKEVKLVKGKETTVEFTFDGFYNYPYYLTIEIDNTRIEFEIDPKSSD